MTTPELIITAFSQVVGAGVGSFWGLKSAINGMRAKVEHTDEIAIKLDVKVDQLLNARG